MDKSFYPAGTQQPPEGKRIELWHCGGIVKGFKRDGTWYLENGTSIGVDGWRPIEKPQKPQKAEVFEPAWSEDDAPLPTTKPWYARPARRTSTKKKKK